MIRREVYNFTAADTHVTYRFYVKSAIWIGLQGEEIVDILHRALDEYLKTDAGYFIQKYYVDAGKIITPDDLPIIETGFRKILYKLGILDLEIEVFRHSDGLDKYSQSHPDGCIYDTKEKFDEGTA